MKRGEGGGEGGRGGKGRGGWRGAAQRGGGPINGTEHLISGEWVMPARERARGRQTKRTQHQCVESICSHRSVWTISRLLLKTPDGTRAPGREYKEKGREAEGEGSTNPAFQCGHLGALRCQSGLRVAEPALKHVALGGDAGAGGAGGKMGGSGEGRGKGREAG